MSLGTNIYQLDGKYRVLAQLGQGGTADVSLAVARGPSGFSKLVVLKSMKTSLSEEMELSDMFMNEARLAARLNHPNIVQTNEVFEFQELPVIVMEYLEGQPLSSVINRCGRDGRPFALDLHLRVISEVLAGLHHAHELKDYDGTTFGVVHRDVSPHNVFLTFDGQVKLLDFGIAKLDHSQAVETATGIIKGKLRYMPPEQITGERVDRRTDVFAIGVMLWEAATFTKMWTGMTDANIMNAILNGEIPRPSSVRPDCDPELEAIIMKALEYEPPDRFGNARELQAAIDDYLAKIGSTARVRDVGPLVADLFHTEREHTQSVIESQMSKVSALTDEELASFQPIELTGTYATGAGVSSTKAAPSRSSKSTIILALVASLLGAGALLLWQQSHAEPPSRATHQVAPPQDETPKDVQLRVTAFPATARLYVDGEPMASNPFSRRFPLDAETAHEVVVRADGHEEETRIIKFDQDQDIIVSLTPKPKPKPEPEVEDEETKEPPRPRPVVPRVRAAKPAKPAPATNPCDPPYFIDSRGVKKFKPECL